jgi:sugar (pentulose or hexulose) kinase
VSGELVCGVDVGTTMAKVAVFDLEDPRRPVSVAEAPAPTRTPRPGWVEADPRELAAGVAEGIRRALGEAAAAGRVRAIGISGTACGAWLVDERGEPVRDAILWNDGRAVATTSRWARDGTMERVHAISGNAPYPGYTLPLLAWLREHERDALDRAATVLCCKDWLRLGLTGEVATEETDASYVPFDIRARDWSEELLELCGVAGERRLLPPLRPETHVAPLLEDPAGRIGLPAGTAVAMGLTDIVSGTLGGGAIRPGEAVSVLGTSAVSTVITPQPVFEPPGVGLMAAAPLGRWARTMVNTSGAMTLDWAARLLCGGDVVALLARAASASPAAGGVIVIPHLSNAGAVTPFVEPEARGVIAGLRADHTVDDVARAAVEGLAIAVADCYAAMPVDVTRIVAVGGAARSDLLLQSIADAGGTEVTRPAGEAFGARSVALMAARAAGLLSPGDLEDAMAAVEPERCFEPGEPGAMSPAIARYRATLAAVRPLWPAWAGGDG